MSAVMNENVQKSLQGNQNKHDSWSLFFDKFSGYSTKKEPILKEVVKHYNAASSKDFIKRGILNKYSFFKNLEKSKVMRFIYLENRSRLLVNMGHSCVLENVGFSFERISGIPCVPGSALKGVVSNWALWEANGDAAFEENLPNFSKDRSILNSELVDIFGANEGEAEQGKINFYGIFPLEVPSLEIDILTPHQGGRIIPNNFLTVAAGTKWVIPIALNRGDESILARAEELIEQCLKNYGVGAKTASGYGKFETPVKTELDSLITSFDQQQKDQEAKLEKAKLDAIQAKATADAKANEETRRANLSPEETEMEDFRLKIQEESLFKAEMANISQLSEPLQKVVCTMLQSTHKEIWQDTLKYYNKGETKGRKGYKRAKAVMDIAKKLGVKL